MNYEININKYTVYSSRSRDFLLKETRQIIYPIPQDILKFVKYFKIYLLRVNVGEII